MDWNTEALASTPADPDTAAPDTGASEPDEQHAPEVHDDDLVVLERLEADLAEIDAELTALNAPQSS